MNITFFAAFCPLWTLPALFCEAARRRGAEHENLVGCLPSSLSSLLCFARGGNAERVFTVQEAAVGQERAAPSRSRPWKEIIRGGGCSFWREMEGTGIVAAIGGGSCCFWEENAADFFFMGNAPHAAF